MQLKGISGLFCLLVIGFSLNAQLSNVQMVDNKGQKVIIGNVENPLTFVAQLSCQADQLKVADTVYTLLFRNFKYSAINARGSIVFKGSTQTVAELNTLFKSVFLEENKRNKNFKLSFTLGDEAITIVPYRHGGKIVARFDYKSAYGLLSETQVDKLFGH